MVIKNRKARFNYEIIKTFEFGIQLFGFEVKSIKAGKASLNGSFVKIYGNEAWIINMSISPYQDKNITSEYDKKRERKLLLHRSELEYLEGKIKEKGLTLIPLSVYSKGKYIKIEVGLGKSRKKYNKKEIIKKRDLERDIRRSLK